MWSADEENLIINADARGLGPKGIWEAHFVHTIRTAKAVRAKHDYLRREGRLISAKNARLPLWPKRARLREFNIQNNYVGLMGDGTSTLTSTHTFADANWTPQSESNVDCNPPNPEAETFIDFNYFEEQGVPHYLAFEELPYYLAPEEM